VLQVWPQLWRPHVSRQPGACSFYGAFTRRIVPLVQGFGVDGIAYGIRNSGRDGENGRIYPGSRCRNSDNQT
jgi:hypothetical protein